MSKYSLSQYLYDCFVLKQLMERLEYIRENAAQTTWGHSETFLISQHIASVNERITRYENLKHNRGEQ